jgi:hypothetical protein
MSSAALEGGHKIGCKRKGVWIHAVQHPGIAKSLKPVDNEPKHGGVAEPISLYEGDGAERRKGTN